MGVGGWGLGVGVRHVCHPPAHPRPADLTPVPPALYPRPLRRLMMFHGSPVGVSHAGRRRSASSRAFRRKPWSPDRSYALMRPPSTLQHGCMDAWMPPRCSVLGGDGYSGCLLLYPAGTSHMTMSRCYPYICYPVTGWSSRRRRRRSSCRSPCSRTPTCPAQPPTIFFRGALRVSCPLNPLSPIHVFSIL